jgi:hypothetical protein
MRNFKQIVYSGHAVLRMKRRHILNEDVENAIRFPDSLRKVGMTITVQKDIGRGTVEVPYVETEKHIKIITVYWL